MRFITVLFLLICTFTTPVICQKKSEFIEPQSGNTIVKDTLTVLLDCKEHADSVSFSIEYMTERGTILKKPLAKLKNPPFKFKLPLDEYPNQVFRGATIEADIFRQDSTERVVLPHIYLQHNNSQISTIDFYQLNFLPVSSLPLYSEKGDTAGSVTFEHHEEGINLSIDIELDNRNGKEEAAKFLNTGVSVMLDPTGRRSPFPNNSLVTVHIPLNEKQTTLVTMNLDSIDAGFNIKKSYTPLSIHKEVQAYSRRINLKATIPLFLIGPKIPDTLHLNIMTANPKADSPLGLFPGEEYKQLSPILYPIIVKAEGINPTMSQSNAFIIFFGIGGIIAIILLISYSVFKRVKKRLKTTKIITVSISKAIGNELHNPNLTISQLAHSLSTTKQDLEKSCQAETGKSFKQYLQNVRLEVVKERLVSSNSSEITIAEECGFKSVADMEQLFTKVIGIAPYKFREKNKVELPS